MLQDLRKEMKSLASPEKAKASQWFFKTGKGQYGEGDIFIGLTVPEERIIAKKHADLSMNELSILLHSPIHEERLIALFVLVSQFRKEKDIQRKKVFFDFYLTHKNRINNWDLVDSSAHKIVGEYLYLTNSGIQILKKLATSSLLWDRRIAILSTAAFIAHGSSKETCEIADILLHDKEDLMHKAVGWMLREVGKRVSRDELVLFLCTRYKTMPRTMLRYSIEHFSVEKRKAYLAGMI